jgi:UPF0755 protein
MRALPDPGPWFRGALLLAWLGAAAMFGYVLLWLPHERSAPRAKDVPYALPSGARLSDVVQLLSQEGVVRDARAASFFLRLVGITPRTGAVVLNRSVSLRDSLPRIAVGYGAAELQVPVPEGFTRFDVATRLARYGIAPIEAVLDATIDTSLLAPLGVAGSSAEGYLFPATYRLAQDSDARGVVARMIRTFRERTRARFDAYREAHADDPGALDETALVTLASMVEREARVPEERRTIAGVFMNRLRDPSFKPKRLQSDPTVAYGCLVAREAAASCAEFDGRRVTPAMVRDPDNAYSTYRREGLPPGPIANPGLSALEAALEPEAHGYFYFVAKGAGRHAFSATLEAHNAEVRAPR